MLFDISGANDVTMLEINEAANIITESIDPNAKVIFGAVLDDEIRKGDVHITVIATGFDARYRKEARLAPPFLRLGALPGRSGRLHIERSNMTGR